MNTVKWLTEKLKEHDIVLTENNKHNFKRIINYLLSGMKR